MSTKHSPATKTETTSVKQQPDQAASAESEVDQFALTDDKVYLAERNQLIKRRDELGDIFDKGRVALAGGAIALSATIMKDLVPEASASTNGLLVWSWMFLTFSLVCSLVCVYIAGLSHERQRLVLDDDRRVGDEGKRLLKHKRANGYNTWLSWLNPISVALLMVGVVLMGATFRVAFLANTSDDGALSLSAGKATRDMSDSNKTTRDTKPADKGTKSFGAADRPVTPTKPPNQGSSTGDSGDKKK